jgi:hypothetical protein
MRGVDCVIHEVRPERAVDFEQDGDEVAVIGSLLTRNYAVVLNLGMEISCF